MDDWVTEALDQLDLNSLVGLTVAQARERVEAAGGRLRGIRPGFAMGLPYSPGLVTVMADEGLVTAVVGLEGKRPQKSIPEPLAELDLESLVGMTTSEARTRITAAGGELHVVASWNTPFDVRPWRVIVEIADDRVVKVLRRG